MSADSNFRLKHPLVFFLFFFTHYLVQTRKHMEGNDPVESKATDGS